MRLSRLTDPGGGVALRHGRLVYPHTTYSGITTSASALLVELELVEVGGALPYTVALLFGVALKDGLFRLLPVHDARSSSRAGRETSAG